MDKDALVSAIASYDKWRLGFGVVTAFSAVIVIAIQIRVLKLNGDLSLIKDTEAAENKRRLALITARAEEAVASAANATRDIEIARAESAEATLRAADSNRQAAEAQERAAEANERGAQAERAAAEAQLQLEQFKAPRRLTDEQRSSLFDAMRGYPGTKFDMAVQGSDPEAGAFIGVLEPILLAAGWVEIGYAGPGDIAFTRPGKPTIGMINLEGVYVQVRQRTGDPANAATQLAGLLTRFGIKTVLAEGSSTNLDGVHVYVGKKAL